MGQTTGFKTIWGRKCCAGQEVSRLDFVFETRLRGTKKKVWFFL